MGLNTRQERIESFKETVRKYEPYPVKLFHDMEFDDDRFPDSNRLASSFALKWLLDNGFTEDEVNPWKEKK